ncbi:MAG: nitronate monooxygenase [Acidobacteria bacterium]|nr:nitronate monooxygenase [Acidobacteriota bacterium]
MRTPVCDLLDIEFPILAFSHCRDVVAAVTKAGGLGVLGAVAHTPKQLEIDLDWIDGEVKGRPYGLDFIVPAKYAGDDKGGLDPDEIANLIPDEHRVFLDEMLDRYDVPALDGDGLERGFGNAVFSASRAQEQMDVAFGHDLALVANALGPPPPELLDRARSENVAVAALAGTPDHALAHVAAGVDLIVAQGYEAGGHTGQIASMVLIPQVVDAAGDIPVLGAGGIASGRQMAAALALGASGVWCGSVWLTTEEAETQPAVKEKFLAAGSSETVRSRSLTGKPARQLRTAWTDEWEREDTPDPLGMPLQSMLVAQAQIRIARGAHVPDSGANKLANYFVGQVVGQMNQVRPAAAVTIGMIEEMIDACERLNTMLEI